jgi:hypothetical protein
MARHFARWVVVFVPALLLAAPGAAQYPKVPKEVQCAEDERRAAYEKPENEAWEKAQPELAPWAKKGKPYIPGAAKPADLPQAAIPAFPGAWGGGMYSFGGRGGKVFVVTSLEDAGPGAFREACNSVGPRMVVFNVAGTIHLKTGLLAAVRSRTAAANQGQRRQRGLKTTARNRNPLQELWRHDRLRGLRYWTCI